MGTLKNFRKKVAQCRKKIKRGGPLASVGFVGYVKKVKNERGDPLETKKFSKKKSHSAEKTKKIRKGDPLGTSGFVCFLEKVKNKGGTLWSKVCLGRTWPQVLCAEL